MNKVTVILASLFLYSFSVFSQHGGHGNHHNMGSGNITQHKTDVKFQKQLKEVYKASLELKEAFVASDGRKAKKNAKNVQSELTKTNMKLLKGPAHMDWMGYSAMLKNSLKSIIDNDDDIVEQRKHYAEFNKALYKSIKAFGIDGEKAFYTFCPMALKNKGGYWLSDSKEIRNPYLGDSMLKCGSVKESL